MSQALSSVLIKRNATADDTVALAQEVAWNERDSEAVKMLLEKIPFEPRLSWFEKMFWLIDSMTEYRYDAQGREQVKTPDRFLLKDRFGDCDDYSTLWMALLNHLDIEHSPKIVDYEKDGYWDHIYVIVPVADGSVVVLDNVYGKFHGEFNKEVEHLEEKIFRKRSV